jgi:hypothetical protein
MNTPTRYAIAMTMALLALPAASRADADAAMDACVQAFVDANIPKEHPVKVRKVQVAENPLNPPERAYRIVLTATGTKSGKRFARGTCTVDRHGEIIAMTARSSTPQLASR